MIEASILVLTKNEARNIDTCLNRIFAQQTTIPYEVIVIDSGSTDGTLEIARRYPVTIHQIPPEDFHHARTRNLAAELSHGEYLVYLAADAFPATDQWLFSLRKHFGDPFVGASYGRHLQKAGCSPERAATLATTYGDTPVVKEQSLKESLGYRYYQLSTVNAAIRKDVWKVTRFPEELKVFEDVGIAKRILDGGWKIVYEPAASVYHSHDFTTRALFKRYFDIGVVYQHLGIFDDRGRSSLWREGLRVVKNKVALTQGDRFAVRKSIVDDAAKYLAITLGRNQQFLPLALKRQLSAFGLFD